MKKFLYGLMIIAAAMFVVTPAFATELWNPHLPGVTEGEAAGALAPPGVYFIMDNYVCPSYHLYGGYVGAPNGEASPTHKVFIIVESPTLLWVPGVKFLGADYGLAIAQPFNYTNFRLQLKPGVDLTGAQWGTFNTIITPYILSWRLPCDFRIKTSFQFALNDATSNPATKDTLGPGAFSPSGNGTYTFQPTLGVSWLHNGWNIGANFYYAVQTEDSGTSYQSGGQLSVDYTVSYTWRKWTFGFGACESNQITNDSQFGKDIPDHKANYVTAGPLVGYNFGPCSVQFAYNFPIYANNTVGGDWFDLRFVVPLWK